MKQQNIDEIKQLIKQFFISKKMSGYNRQNSVKLGKRAYTIKSMAKNYEGTDKWIKLFKTCEITDSIGKYGKKWTNIKF